MATSYSKQALAFYNTAAWQKCRNAYIKKRIAIDGGMCEQCHDELGYIVHHKTHLNETNLMNQEISLNHSNLEYVCKLCHDTEHLGWKPIKPLLCGFDEKGRPINNGSSEECHENI